jgi:hypothetical protein
MYKACASTYPKVIPTKTIEAAPWVDELGDLPRFSEVARHFAKFAFAKIPIPYTKRVPIYNDDFEEVRVDTASYLARDIRSIENAYVLGSAGPNGNPSFMHTAFDALAWYVWWFDHKEEFPSFRDIPLFQMASLVFQTWINLVEVIELEAKSVIHRYLPKAGKR